MLVQCHEPPIWMDGSMFICFYIYIYISPIEMVKLMGWFSIAVLTFIGVFDGYNMI